MLNEVIRYAMEMLGFEDGEEFEYNYGNTIKKYIYKNKEILLIEKHIKKLDDIVFVTFLKYPEFIIRKEKNTDGDFRERVAKLVEEEFKQMIKLLRNKEE